MMLINTHEILTLNVFIIDKTKNNSKFSTQKRKACKSNMFLICNVPIQNIKPRISTKHFQKQLVFIKWEVVSLVCGVYGLCMKPCVCSLGQIAVPRAYLQQ